MSFCGLVGQLSYESLGQNGNWEALAVLIPFQCNGCGRVGCIAHDIVQYHPAGQSDGVQRKSAPAPNAYPAEMVSRRLYCPDQPCGDPCGEAGAPSRFRTNLHLPFRQSQLLVFLGRHVVQALRHQQPLLLLPHCDQGAEQGITA